MEHNSCTPISFGYRPDERIWLLPTDKESLSVYYALNLEDETDRLIGSLIFNEFEEVRRHVNDAPSFHFIKHDLPVSFTKAFPNVKHYIKDHTLVLSMLLFKSHMSEARRENTATLLQGFRQFIHYHTHASKTFIHGKIRKKTQLALRQINLTKYEIEGIKIYRGRKGKGNLVNMMEDNDEPKDIILRG